MIEASLENINILYPDGTSAVFDSSSLKERIARACAESNCQEITIAEDIALAVEFALRSSFRESGCKNIRFRELENAVSDALEEAGFPLVAEKYLQHTAGTSAGNWKLAFGDMEEFLARNMKLSPEESRTLTEKVRKGLTLLGFSSCSPRLITELARELREKAALEEAEERGKMVSGGKKRKRVIPLTGEELLAVLPASLQFLLEKEILHCQELSPLFPSVRLEIHLVKLLEWGRSAGSFFAESPFLELDLYPLLAQTAQGVDLLYKEIRSRVEQEQEKEEETLSAPLPLILTIPDALEFVRENMLETHAPEKTVRSLGSLFRTLLQTQPFRIRYSK